MRKVPSGRGAAAPPRGAPPPSHGAARPPSARVGSGFNTSRLAEDLRRELLESLTPEERKRVTSLSNVTVTEKYEGQIDAQSRRHGSGVLKWSNGNCYFGAWVEGSMCGEGTFLYGQEEDSYRGEFSNDKKHGTGRYVFANGNSYDGEFLVDKRHGRGRYSWTCGDSYDGEWRDGRMHGFGVTIYANGNRYEGTFVEDRREGEGTLRCTDGLSYSGSWLCNKRHGLGTLTFPTKDYYCGEWANDTKHGRGKDVFVNGNEFDGHYVENQKCGHGIMRYANGDCYDGEWLSDKMHGMGTYRFANGFVYEGEWQADARHGHGTYRFPSGHVYDGAWERDKRHGRGTLTLAPAAGGAAEQPQRRGRRERYVGTWVGGKMHGAFEVMRLPAGDTVGTGRKVYEGRWEGGAPSGEGAYHFTRRDLLGDGGGTANTEEGEDDDTTPVFMFSGRWDTAKAARKSDGTVEFPTTSMTAIALPLLHPVSTLAAVGERDPVLNFFWPVALDNTTGGGDGDGSGGGFSSLALDGIFAAGAQRASADSVVSRCPSPLRQLLSPASTTRAQQTLEANAKRVASQCEMLRAYLAKATDGAQSASGGEDPLEAAKRDACEAEAAAARACAERDEVLGMEKVVPPGEPEAPREESVDTTALQRELEGARAAKLRAAKEGAAVAAQLKVRAEVARELDGARAKLSDAELQSESIGSSVPTPAAAAAAAAAERKAKLEEEVSTLRLRSSEAEAQLGKLQAELTKQGGDFRARIKKLEQQRARHDCAAEELAADVLRVRRERERASSERAKLAAAQVQQAADNRVAAARVKEEVAELQAQLNAVIADTDKTRAAATECATGTLAAAVARREQLEEEVEVLEGERQRMQLRRELACEEIPPLVEEAEAAEAAEAEAARVAQEMRAAREAQEVWQAALQRQMDRELVALQAELETAEEARRQAEGQLAEAQFAAGRAAAQQPSSAPPVGTSGAIVGRIRRTTSSLLPHSQPPNEQVPAEGGAPASEAADDADAAEVRRRLGALDAQMEAHEAAIAQLQRQKASLDNDLAAAKAARKAAKRRGDGAMHRRSSARNESFTFTLGDDEDDDDESGSSASTPGTAPLSTLRADAGREALANQLRSARNAGDALQREKDKLLARVQEARASLEDARRPGGGGAGSEGRDSSSTIEEIIRGISRDDWRLRYLADQVTERGRVLAQLQLDYSRVGQLEEQLNVVQQSIGAMQSDESRGRLGVGGGPKRYL